MYNYSIFVGLLKCLNVVTLWEIASTQPDVVLWWKVGRNVFK